MINTRTSRIAFSVSFGLWLIASATFTYVAVWLGPVHWWSWTIVGALGLNLLGTRMRHMRPGVYTPLVVAGGIVAACGALGALLDMLSRPVT